MEPILFVHGIAGDEKDYKPLIDFLKTKEFDKFYEFKYASRIGIHPIKVIAKELAEYIEKNIKEEKINIIALSQGGIIALAYLKYFFPIPNGKNLHINKLFTICAPHRGSMVAKMLNWPGIIDLRPNSELLKDLETFVKEGRVNLYSVYTPFDLMVFPGINAKPMFGKTKMVLAPFHVSAFYWPSTKKFILDNLI
jgi:triacylglycerol lipase